jgi:hypothetical protein
MKDGTFGVGTARILVTGLLAVAVFGSMAFVTIIYIADGIASRTDIRGALFMRSAYDDAGSEVVRYYRVALKRQNKAELCVLAGMAAAVYAQAHPPNVARPGRGKHHLIAAQSFSHEPGQP